MGISNEHFIQRDSTQWWLEDKKLDYVISTYTGYINGHSAFDFCLGKCLNDKLFKGKYAGMVPPREIFENTTENFKEALSRNWIETIVLLPFGEAAVLVNAKRRNKKTFKLIDCNNPLTRRTRIEEIVADNKYAISVDVKEAMENGYLKSILAPDLPERNGYEKMCLRDVITKIPRKVYNLDDFEDDEKVLAYIDRDETWYGNCWDENIKRRRINNLFGPAYFLNVDCLIVNSSGHVEPRKFDADNGSVFFEDGYAFSIDGFNNLTWVAEELNKKYIHHQLHPYGDNQMVPEPLTEEDYLNLVIYKEIENDLDVLDLDESDSEENTKTEEGPKDVNDSLEVGYVLKDGNIKYTILNFIAHGSFGYTYKAEMLKCSTGEKEIVAIKEFYPTGVMNCNRQNNRVVIDEYSHNDFMKYKEMFCSEPEFIMSIADVAENHVTEIKSIFEYEPTGTVYYVMKYYAGESLNDMILSNQIPSSEELIIEKIIRPLCKALHAMHSHNILHLDIKPDNIVIDENGKAVLIDFGTAQLYDKEGNLLSRVSSLMFQFLVQKRYGTSSKVLIIMSL